MDATPVIEARGLTKTFGSGPNAVTALRGIDLQVEAGELLLLVGPSGCGKTTLISVMAAILRHDQGRCQVLGADLAAMPDRERVAFRRDNIGFVFQAFNLIPSLPARLNVAVPLLLQGRSHPAALAAADAMLAEVGLGERRHALPGQLSGGQQQRVAIARALVHQPRLVVCDEPTSALDHATGEQVMTLLRAIARQPGRGLVIVTHDSRVFHHADRIAAMDDGRVVGIGPPPAVASAH
ncbi:MAG: ABC transporter ATP-binding protein [Planctomycetes bacterium]|nr:ABC transporter ATP-binding protein [Planctomycetota bacterium]